ncbi:phosphate transport system substrate-binding protein [Sporomusaceae bacterium BoRhaA]|uniref:phosphate ABC transporter substrate-binding protein n=1 Tax=Pelorhabdus rhamnosifermentans TaxID=2772457 RepID=UPI001C06134D|nr:phosphate ABC transporter substrate-binding protein [Pelorhabdus rhamnosifermentans]MBU2700965.1 phosphate transport system substrate-binding protein [Pelorhabdus rhamnosifermentans]
MWKKVLMGAMMATMMMGATAMASDSHIQMGGSSSVFPLAQKLTSQYMQENSGVDFHVTYKDSGAGIKGAADGTFDIGNASRDLNSTDPAGLVSTTICQDAVVMIVNPNVKVKNLTTAQVQAIYSGKDANNKAVVYWSDVQAGLPHTKIVVETREAGSGTLDCFTKQIMGTTQISSIAKVNDGSPALKTAVATTPNAIGFISLGYVDNSTVMGCSLNGVTASVATIHNKTYSAWRNFNMITKGAPATGSNVQNFITWVLGSEGQAIVSADGEIPNATSVSAAANHTQRTERTQRAHR